LVRVRIGNIQLQLKTGEVEEVKEFDSWCAFYRCD
jgi:hypothetical protein